MNVNIIDFGAVADGYTINTTAIQMAIDACAAAGGGIVNIPPGTFITGTLRLRSHLTIRLEPGATLKGSDHLADYPPLAFNWYNEFSDTTPLLYAVSEHHIRIDGEGIIDLNDSPFVNWDTFCTGLEKEQSACLSDRQRNDCHVNKPEARPNRPIFFKDCEQVNITNITVKNSPCWALTFSQCQHIRLHNLSIANSMRVPNSDGIHCCGCKDVLISGCFISAGDDCIAITGIADFNVVNERIIISDCTFRSASSAIRIGFLASKIRDIQLNNLIIHDSNRAIAIFAGDGGSVENISIDNVSIETRIYAGPWWGKGEPLVICAASPLANISNISVRNVTARSENSIMISGGQDIILKDWAMTLSYGEARPLYGANLDFSPHPGHPAPDATKSIPWLNAENVKNLITENIKVKRASGERYSFDTTAVVK